MLPENETLAPQLLQEIIKVQTAIAQTGPDLGSLMQLVCEEAQKLTAAGGAVIELAEEDDMVYRAASGMGEAQLGLRLKKQGSLSGLCMELGEALSCEDSETDPRVNREACRRVGLRSMLVVPLKHANAIIGVLKVMSASAYAFGKTQGKVLEMLSGMIAASMFHAAVYETNELFYRATHDALTGLANRALFYDRLRQRIAQALRNSDTFGVLILDLDGLKQVNDNHGHKAGDALIKEFAARITPPSRRADTIARLGGDEFGILLSKIENAEEVAAAVERLNEHIRKPFQFEQHAGVLQASIGAAIFPHDGTDVDTLLEKADQEMYTVKKKNKAG